MPCMYSQHKKYYTPLCGINTSKWDAIVVNQKESQSVAFAE